MFELEQLYREKDISSLNEQRAICKQFCERKGVDAPAELYKLCNSTKQLLSMAAALVDNFGKERNLRVLLSKLSRVFDKDTLAKAINTLSSHLCIGLLVDASLFSDNESMCMYIESQLSMLDIENDEPHEDKLWTGKMDELFTDVMNFTNLLISLKGVKPSDLVKWCEETVHVFDKKVDTCMLKHCTTLNELLDTFKANLSSAISHMDI